MFQTKAVERNTHQKNMYVYIYIYIYIYMKLLQKLSTVSLLKKQSSKVSYKILLLSDSTVFKLFFHIFAAIIEVLTVAGHKFVYTLLIECGRLRC